jgi:metal-responsive CopG/Arc/MetJ family transcriptional regulator
MTDPRKLMFEAPKALVDRLDEAAKAEMLSRSDALRQAARRYIEAHEAKQVAR